MKRFILVLLAWLMPALALAQSLPSPRFTTPPSNDNAERAATTSFVQRELTAGLAGKQSLSSALTAISGLTPVTMPAFQTGTTYTGSYPGGMITNQTQALFQRNVTTQSVDHAHSGVMGIVTQRAFLAGNEVQEGLSGLSYLQAPGTYTEYNIGVGGTAFTGTDGFGNPASNPASMVINHTGYMVGIYGSAEHHTAGVIDRAVGFMADAKSNHNMGPGSIRDSIGLIVTGATSGTRRNVGILFEDATPAQGSLASEADILVNQMNGSVGRWSGGSKAPSLAVQSGLFNVQVSTGVELDIGGDASGSMYLQSRATANGSVAYPVALNPVGGNVGIGTVSPTSPLDVAGDRFRLRNSYTPPSPSAPCNAGEQAWDASYTYVCVAANTWKRAALSAW